MLQWRLFFIEGACNSLAGSLRLREAIMNAIPVSLRHAISVGLAFFIAMIGLKNAGFLLPMSQLWLRLVTFSNQRL